MSKKSPVPFEQKFPNADPLALRLLQRLLAFDPKDRPTAEEVSVHLSCIWSYVNPGSCTIRSFYFQYKSMGTDFSVWLVGTS